MGLVILFAFAALLLTLLGVAGIAWLVLRPPRRSFGAALARGYPTEPKDVGLAGKEVSFSLPGGARTLGFVLQGAKAEGPVAVVLHGHASSRFSALARTPWLAPHCATVVCFDWRGNGDAAGPGAVACDFGAMAGEDIAAVLAQVPGAAGRPLVLMGCSMGAGCALRAATTEPLAGRVACLVLDGAYRHWGVGIRNRLHERRKPVFFFFFVRFVVERFLPHLRHEDAYESVQHLRCPVLFLHGAADGVCPLADVQAVAAAVPHDLAELVVFPAGGHLGLHRSDPARYEAALGGFLRKNGAIPGHAPHPCLAQ